MSDLHLKIIQAELDRMHKILESSVPEDDEFYWAMINIERLVCALTGSNEGDELTDPTEDFITEMMEKLPTGDAQ